jgi:hypothetical protein
LIEIQLFSSTKKNFYSSEYKEMSVANTIIVSDIHPRIEKPTFKDVAEIPSYYTRP